MVCRGVESIVCFLEKFQDTPKHEALTECFGDLVLQSIRSCWSNSSDNPLPEGRGRRSVIGHDHVAPVLEIYLSLQEGSP